VSDTVKLTIHEAIAEVKREIGVVEKNERNTQQGYNFRGIDAVVNAAGPSLNKYGVITAPHLDDITTSVVEIGKNRTPMQYVLVTVTYTFEGPAGDSLTARVPGEAMDSGDKAASKAMSVAWRTALIQVFNLRTDEQEPDSKTYERSPLREPAQQGGDGAPDDYMIAEWGSIIDKLATSADADQADAHLRQVFRKGGMNSRTAAAIRAAITAKKATLPAGPRNGGAPDQVEHFAQQIRNAETPDQVQAVLKEIREKRMSSASFTLDGKTITLAAFSSQRRAELTGANGNAVAGVP